MLAEMMILYGSDIVQRHEALENIRHFREYPPIQV